MVEATLIRQQQEIENLNQQIAENALAASGSEWTDDKMEDNSHFRSNYWAWLFFRYLTNADQSQGSLDVIPQSSPYSTTPAFTLEVCFNYNPVFRQL